MFPAQSEAHNGARDELGGHFRNADCVYLLHDPSDIAKSAANMDELIQLIKRYSSNSSCTSQLTAAKVDLEGYAVTNETANDTSTQSSVSSKAYDGEIKLGKKYPAELVKCIDGDTAHFKVNGQVYKTRFLYIDTPESTNQIEPFGKEASAFTCHFLKSGTITLETDGNSVFDKYDRLLAWVWVDDHLHQEEITKAGFVEDFYDYGHYLYEDRIIKAMDDAKRLSKGMYASQKVEEDSTVNHAPVETVKPSKSETIQAENQLDEKKEKTADSSDSPLNEIIGIIAVLSLVLFFRKRKNSRK